MVEVELRVRMVVAEESEEKARGACDRIRDALGTTAWSGFPVAFLEWRVMKKTRTCWACQGSGRVWFGWRRCAECLGRGVQDVDTLTDEMAEALRHRETYRPAAPKPKDEAELERMMDRLERDTVEYGGVTASKETKK